jgi:hypothetical protein
MIVMMGYYKGRGAYIDYPSEVYFNLHKHTFSMVQNGLVVLHSDVIVLEDVTFKVSEAGRQRVLAEGRKNVHAKVYGNFVKAELEQGEGFGWSEAYYNPYKVSTFVDVDTGEPIHEASQVILANKAIFYKK